MNSSGSQADCDGDVDGADSNVTGANTWYTDSDGDNYGDETSGVVSCTQPSNTLTTGGEGVALFWPYDSSRHFFEPWRPIPVSPIGLDYFSPRGLRVAVIETLGSLPLWCVAFWPRKIRNPLPAPESPDRNEAPPGSP